MGYLGTWDQQLAVQESATIHHRSRLLLSAVDTHGGLILLENPSTSMTWDDPLMYEWVHATAPYGAQASACKFGKDWAKTWMFVSNRPDIFAVACSCDHLPGQHQSIVGARLPDGTFLSRLTAEYPVLLAEALASIISPYVSHDGHVLPLHNWRDILPSQLEWPLHQSRVEDGGGLPSTACHFSAGSKDPLQHLRKRWFTRLCDSKHCLKITAALTSGCKGDPLSSDELSPYISDLLDFLGLPPGDHLLTVPPGQPFRLDLWLAMARHLQDPDGEFLSMLKTGVPLGVNEALSPSPAWPTHAPCDTMPEPLVDHIDAWKSARDHPDIVADLIQAEIADGFIEPVPGGLSALKHMYSRTAVGKLGVVLAPNRSPRLVVDSSISNVTVNTHIPNHTLLPRISDVMSCAPASWATFSQGQRCHMIIKVEYYEVIVHNQA